MPAPATDLLAGRPADEARSLPVLTLVAASITALLLVLPLLLNPYLPFEDLPNHIARRHIMAGADEALAAHYQLKGGLATNAAVDLVWQLRMWLAPVTAQTAITFSHWAMGFAMLGFVGAVMVLHRVLHGRWSPWPLIAGLLVCNGNVLWGFENYVVTIPIGILGFALWIASRRAGPLLRMALTLGVVTLLYLGHVLVLLAYALLVFGYEGGRAWRARRNAGRLTAGDIDWPGLCIVLAACMTHLLVTATAQPAGYGSDTRFGPWSARLEVLLSPFGTAYPQGALLHPLIDQAIPLLCILAVFWVLARRFGVTFRLAAPMQAPLLLLGLATLLIPAQLSGVYFTHLRYPFLVFGLLAAATDVRAETRRASMILAVGLLALIAAIAVRASILDRAARAYSDQIADVAVLAGALRADMPAGARVLPVAGTPAGPMTTRGLHTAAYLVPLAEAFVPTLFVGGSHSLGIAPGLGHLSAPQPSAPPALVLDLAASRWSPANDEAWGFVPGWRDTYSHILFIGAAPEEFESQFGLRRVATKGTGSLFAVPQPAD